MKSIIILLSVLPIIFVFLCAVCHKNYSRDIALIGSLLSLNLSMFLLLVGKCYASPVFVFGLPLPMGLQYSVQLSYLSCFLVDLTALLIVFCILISWVSVQHRAKEFYVILLIIEFFLFQVFLVDDILLFYFFYEGVVVPVFLLIAVWGSRERRVVAAYQFFFFTFIGSILMLFAILYLYYACGSTSMVVLRESMGSISHSRLVFVWLALFFAFAVKAPMVPVHSWLPEAHVEAPTAGSVLLAGILLKMGIYGMYKFLVVPLPALCSFFFPFVGALALVSITHISTIILVQIDLKKIIAYASIAHMNYLIIGLFSSSSVAVSGALYLSIMHGVISSGLFICVGVLYDRYKTRIIYYYSGLDRVMPLFSFFFFILLLGNFGFPFCGSFVAELLILLGVADKSFILVFLLGFNILLGAVYSIWLYIRIFFGDVSKHIKEYSDVNRRESFVLSILCALTVIMGILPFIVSVL